LIAASLVDAVFLLAVDITDLDNGLIVEIIEQGAMVLECLNLKRAIDALGIELPTSSAIPGGRWPSHI